MVAMRTIIDQQKLEVLRRINKLIQSGRPFTVDQIWRDDDDFRPAEHRNWIGRHIQELASADTIEWVEWKMTDRSSPHSRPTRVWQAKRPA